MSDRELVSMIGYPDGPAGRIRRWVVLSVVSALALAIVLATIVPLDWRPRSGFPPNGERFFAFMALGLALALMYPRRLLFALAIVLGLAVALELSQFIAFDRDPARRDVAVKLLGGSAGVVAGFGWIQLVVALRRVRGLLAKRTILRRAGDPNG